MPDNNANSADLSAGNTSSEDGSFAQALLIDQQQKATFRTCSFIGAWVFSGLFFLSVISFSWAVMFCPKAFLLTQAIHLGEAHISHENPENTKTKEETNSKVKNPDSKNVAKTESETTQRENLFNQFLIMLALLSAVGTTLAIAVMRFSFSNENSTEKDSSILSISPLANSVAELIDQIVSLIKSRSN
jgi:hypothetical protein